MDLTRLREPKDAARARVSPPEENSGEARFGVFERAEQVTADLSPKSSPNALASKLGSSPRLEMLITERGPLRFHLRSFWGKNSEIVIYILSF